MKIPLSKLFATQLIVWNVGQGQWVTEVSPQQCIHYDLGGEKDATAQFFPLCREKPNYLYLSHWDWDHISFAAKFSAKIRNACLVKLPQGLAAPFKKKQISQIPLCKDSSLVAPILYAPRPEKKSRPNDLSQVVFSKRFQVLIPGDSTNAQERKWAQFSRPDIHGLILGHHGSRTSTSEDLLQSLPNLKWSVASARSAKYGHPHMKVLRRLQKKKVPVLRTEDWGHIHFMNQAE